MITSVHTQCGRHHMGYVHLLCKEYYFNILIWTMYNIYEIFYLITVYKSEAA